MRWAAGVEYVGTHFNGWQAQAGLSSVQGAVEAALSTVANHPLTVTCAGRTDAGVHAFGQVVHFDSEAPRTPYAWLLGSNTLLPPEVSLSWVQPAAADFDARRSALHRRYRYLILNRRGRSALLGGRATWVARELDAGPMHRAAQALVGEHDFSAFRAAECQSPTPMRNLQAIAVFRRGSFVVIDVQANAFLHHMVRNIVGSLIEVGHGKRGEAWLGELLTGRRRAVAGMTAAAAGLYFCGPQYPERFGLPGPAEPWLPG